MTKCTPPLPSYFAPFSANSERHHQTQKSTANTLTISRTKSPAVNCRCHKPRYLVREQRSAGRLSIDSLNLRDTRYLAT